MHCVATELAPLQIPPATAEARIAPPTPKEAMDISKKYSSEDSVVFINGILGAYKSKLES